MKNKPHIILKPNREKSLITRHPWIFSGACDKLVQIDDGNIADVFSSTGQFLAKAYVNRKSNIIARVLSFEDKPIDTILNERIDQAIYIRKTLFRDSNTNSYRLINAESDGLPGLIVDVYNTVLVLQISTLGMEKLKHTIVDILIKKVQPEWIYEHSTQSSRSYEGLEPSIGTLYGKEKQTVAIMENGCTYNVSIVSGQKTGFFLDLREMRSFVAQFAKGKKVLNCFSYTGGFTVSCLKAGATHCTSVDISQEALQMIDANLQLNKIALQAHKAVCVDAFIFLKDEDLSKYDIVILDPPAFAKKEKHIGNAQRGYREINRNVFSKVRSGTFVLTCSCSHFMDETLFKKTLFEAALSAGRELTILQQHRLAYDHPISIYHPESNYLKSIFAVVW